MEKEQIEAENWVIKAVCPFCMEEIEVYDLGFIYDENGHIQNAVIVCPECGSILRLR